MEENSWGNLVRPLCANNIFGRTLFPSFLRHRHFSSFSTNGFYVLPEALPALGFLFFSKENSKCWEENIERLMTGKESGI